MCVASLPEPTIGEPSTAASRWKPEPRRLACRVEAIVSHCDPSVNLYDGISWLRGDAIEANVVRHGPGVRLVVLLTILGGGSTNAP